MTAGARGSEAPWWLSLGWVVVVWFMVALAACAYDAAPEQDGGVLSADAPTMVDGDLLDAPSEPDTVAPDVALDDSSGFDVAPDVELDVAPSRCEVWCGHALGCIGEVCLEAISEGEVFEEECAAWCDAVNPIDAEVEAFLDRACGDVAADMCVGVAEVGQRCACDGLPWQDENTGEPCEGDMACSANCLPEVFDGMFSGFTDGYCSAPCDSHLQCGLGNVCVTFANDRACLQGCVVGQGGCREGYACWPSGLTSPDGYCFPDCDMALQCAAGQMCVDGVCL